MTETNESAVPSYREDEITVSIPVQFLGKHTCGGDVLFEGVSRKTVCSKCGEEGARTVSGDAMDFEITEST